MLVFLMASLLAVSSAFAQAQNEFYLKVDFSKSKDLMFLTGPDRIKLTTYLNAELPSIDAGYDGALSANKKYLDVYASHADYDVCFVRAEAQRGLWTLVAYGVASNDVTAIKNGLLAIKWTLDKNTGNCVDDVSGHPWLGQEGAVPKDKNDMPVRAATQNESTAHNKHMFLAAAARSLRLLKAFKVPSTILNYTSENNYIQTEVAKLAPRLFAAAKGLNAQKYIRDEFFGQMIALKKASNQLLLAAVAYHESAVIHYQTATLPADQTAAKQLIEDAKNLMEKVVGIEGQDYGPLLIAGVLPEGEFTSSPKQGGFDTSYQTFSVELMSRYYLTLNASKPYAISYANKIKSALNRFLENVIGGHVDTCRNTRTTIVSRAAEKTIPWRLFYAKYLFQASDPIYSGELGVYANSIDGSGQAFDHIPEGQVAVCLHGISEF